MENTDNLHDLAFQAIENQIGIHKQTSEAGRESVSPSVQKRPIGSLRSALGQSPEDIARDLHGSDLSVVVSNFS